MTINQAPNKTLEESPRLCCASLTGIATVVAVATRFGSVIALFLQNLLLAMHESRLQKARSEIQGLRHLLPATKDVTSLHALCCNTEDQPTRGPAQRPARTRREPSEAA